MMNENEILVHHGIKGQRWGVRRFQNEDGTRTAAGKRREERDRDFAKKHFGSTDEDYDKAMEAVTKARADRAKAKTLAKESKRIERARSGSGKLLEKNESSAAQKYKAAKAAEKKALSEYDADTDWDEYDRRTNSALDARKQAFKESKSNFKANKTLGQKVANQILNGPIGAGVYNNMRASGHSVATSEATVIASTILAGPLGQAAAYLITRNG